jgi:hypothetical protein
MARDRHDGALPVGGTQSLPRTDSGWLNLLRANLQRSLRQARDARDDTGRHVLSAYLRVVSAALERLRTLAAARREAAAGRSSYAALVAALDAALDGEEWDGAGAGPEGPVGAQT